MARGVFGGLVTGLALGIVALALWSLAWSDEAADGSRADGSATVAPPSPPTDRTVPQSGLPRLRSDTGPADPTRPSAR